MQSKIVLSVCCLVPNLCLASPEVLGYKSRVDKFEYPYVTAMDGSVYFVPKLKSTIKFMDEIVIYQVQGDWHVCHDGNNYLARQQRSAFNKNYRQDLHMQLSEIERLRECY